MTPRTKRQLNVAARKRTKIPAEALTPAEYERLLAAAKAHSPRLYAMVLLARNHGLRASEVCALRPEHVTGNGTVITLYRRKGSRPGTHPLTAEEQAALAPFLEAPGTLFVIHRTQFYNLYRGIAQASGLPPSKQGPHSLKHTCAKLALNGGAPIAAVQQFVGWRSLNSMQRYLKYSDEEASA